MGSVDNQLVSNDLDELKQRIQELMSTKMNKLTTRQFIALVLIHKAGACAKKCIQAAAEAVSSFLSDQYGYSINCLTLRAELSRKYDEWYVSDNGQTLQCTPLFVKMYAALIRAEEREAFLKGVNDENGQAHSSDDADTDNSCIVSNEQADANVVTPRDMACEAIQEACATEDTILSHSSLPHRRKTDTLPELVMLKDAIQQGLNKFIKHESLLGEVKRDCIDTLGGCITAQGFQDEICKQLNISSDTLDSIQTQGRRIEDSMKIPTALLPALLKIDDEALRLHMQFDKPDASTPHNTFELLKRTMSLQKKLKSFHDAFIYRMIHKSLNVTEDASNETDTIDEIMNYYETHAHSMPNVKRRRLD